ncbi:MAG: polysaccharide pyruvyl transferase family protein [Cellvibrionaceae bacterium]|nr:polysaccharide pyruvyl transferase family protein [Cellvibrionaceae bacterium]
MFIDYQKKCMGKASIWLSNIKNFSKKIFPLLFFGRAPAVTPSIRESISKNTRSFVCSEVVPISSEITEVDELKRLGDRLDGIIVGSDQVWRPAYTPRVESYFLDFLGNDKLKIAYAASFGSDDWSFSKEQLFTFLRAIKEFDFVSVREISAVDVIKAKCGVEAKCVLDPTLLLSAQHYMDLVNRLGHCSFDGELFCYSLDETPFSQAYQTVWLQSMVLNPITSSQKISTWTTIKIRNNMSIPQLVIGCPHL